MAYQILAIISMVVLLVALLAIVAQAARARKNITTQAETFRKNHGDLTEDEKIRLGEEYRAKMTIVYRSGAVMAGVGLILGIIAIILKYTV